MESVNSPGGVYLRLFQASHRDVASALAYPTVEFGRDAREIAHRFQKEGLSFLTKTIPSLGKAIDIALSTGAALRCRGFKLKRGTQIPQFLGCLIEQVFDPSGHERSDASVEALRWLRELAFLCYKLAVPTTEKQNNDVIELFKKTDRELPHHSESPILGVPSGGAVLSVHGSASFILRSAARLCRRVVGMVDPRGRWFAPRHGPGAVSGGEKLDRKFAFDPAYSDLYTEFPFEEHFVYNVTHLSDVYAANGLLEPREPKAGTAKVVLVPKDSRGPRLISCEPKEFQWIQQGLRRSLEKAISMSRYTAGRVNFTDQEVNRDLALRGSRGEPWVTLDMKEASDRVSLALVREMFPDPWYRCLVAARSGSTLLPSGQVFQMRKFAPMGSACCFPVESLVFWCLAVAAIHHTKPDVPIYQIGRAVFVYGDDLIVRSEDQAAVRQTLPLYGLLFNEAKCCVEGFFRESCGCDAYRGVDVTPLRLRATWDRRNGMSIVSYVSIHNAACVRGMYNLADYIRAEMLDGVSIPYSGKEGVGYVCLVDDRKTAAQVKIHNRKCFKRRRYNRRLHKWEVFTWVVRARVQNAGSPGWSEMLRIASYKSPIEGDRSAPDGHDYPLLTAARRFERDSTFGDQLFRRLFPDAPLVTACRYALPRQATLRRGWIEEVPQ